MAKKRKGADKRADEGAQVLFTELVDLSFDHGAIKMMGRSGGYVAHGHMTFSFARDLLVRLAQILAEHGEDPPPCDKLGLEVDGEHVRFTLYRGGKPILTGRVTQDVAERAHDWLVRLFSGPNVAVLRKK